MTCRELARLQSFPDTFLFKGSKSAILKQIGNAVPPLMAKAIGLSVKSMLGGIK
jgi:DNA (cytosine-5)-methyltransferase 1